MTDKAGQTWGDRLLPWNDSVVLRTQLEFGGKMEVPRRQCLLPPKTGKWKGIWILGWASLGLWTTFEAGYSVGNLYCRRERCSQKDRRELAKGDDERDQWRSCWNWIGLGVEWFGLHVGPKINGLLINKNELAQIHNEVAVNVGPNYSNNGFGEVGLYWKGSTSETSSKQQKRQPWCEHYRKIGHKEDMCWDLHGSRLEIEVK